MLASPEAKLTGAGEHLAQAKSSLKGWRYKHSRQSRRRKGTIWKLAWGEGRAAVQRATGERRTPISFSGGHNTWVFLSKCQKSLSHNGEAGVLNCKSKHNSSGHNRNQAKWNGIGHPRLNYLGRTGKGVLGVA